MTAIQTINRLTPLPEVRALLADGTRPVPARAVPLSEAADCTLAEPVRVAARPSTTIALQDGWALRAEDTLGAGGYAPALLPQMPVRIEAGAPMPPDKDCVAPFDALRIKGDAAEALVSLGAGEGVLPAGGDANDELLAAGARLRPADIAALSALGVATLTVRKPRLRIAIVREDPILAATLQFVCADAARRGGGIETSIGLTDAFADERSDALIVIGGTGSGRNDESVTALARAGRVVVHGIALTPGETAALGFIGARPVLLLPGRLDAALAVWLLLGRELIDRLTGVDETKEAPETLTLARKIASTVGLTEFVPVRRRGGEAEPLATRYLPLSILLRADGYVVVPPESEGSSAGTPIRVWPWP
jgi:molybdopterin biosynthesis enzyme